MSEEVTITLYTPVDAAAAAALGTDDGSLFESHPSKDGTHTTLNNTKYGDIYNVFIGWIRPVILHVGDTVRFKSVASGREDVAPITRIDPGDDLVGLLVDGRTWWYDLNEIIMQVEKEETHETQ